MRSDERVVCKRHMMARAEIAYERSDLEARSLDYPILIARDVDSGWCESVRRRFLAFWRTRTS